MDAVFHLGRHECLRSEAHSIGRPDRRTQMSKTRNQRGRSREQKLFTAAVSLWMAAMVGLIVWKAVTG